LSRGTEIHFITNSIVLNLADKSTLQVQARFHPLLFHGYTAQYLLQSFANRRECRCHRLSRRCCCVFPKHPLCMTHYVPTIQQASIYTQSQYRPTMQGFVLNDFSARVKCRVFCGSYSSKIMVEKVVHITSEYEERLRRCEYVPRLSFGLRMLRDNLSPLFPFHSFLMPIHSYNTHHRYCDSLVFFLIPYHHSLFSIHSSCKFIPTTLIIVRLEFGVIFF
jgi:hypothetical protein